MAENLIISGLSRRDFLKLSSLSLTGLIAGCAVNPVTGKKMLALMSEQEETEIDRLYAPLQFSSDLGSVQDNELNQYISTVGTSVASVSHRPKMPFSFRAVNAVYANAYAFPGGSIAVTRGLLLSLNNEAELAGLLGHEVAHVAARHTASRMSKAMLLNLAVVLTGVIVSTKDEKAGMITAGLGMIGSTLLLAKYSREDERQADELGMEYMVKAGYAPSGMVGLMDHLRRLSNRQPDVIEKMFSSHPMSEERYQTAVKRMTTVYGDRQSLTEARERYMDRTAELRRLKDVIENLQNGQKAMAEKKYQESESFFKKGLAQAPDDYAALVMMGALKIVKNELKEAEKFAEAARLVYPQEAQSYNLSGTARLLQKKYALALESFDQYEKILPEDPNPAFYKGFSQEQMQRKGEAAREYQRYLEKVKEGEQADYARQRLREWGYSKS